MDRLLAIAAGGAVGATLRYLVAGLVHRISGASFPWGTLTVNILGCFVLGLLGTAIAGPLLMREELRLGLLVGLLGAFTTFSTFGWETMMLLSNGRWALATGNLLLSNGLGLLAVFCGYRLAQRIWGI
jgi:CrcB protein